MTRCVDPTHEIHSSPEGVLIPLTRTKSTDVWPFTASDRPLDVKIDLVDQTQHQAIVECIEEEMAGLTYGFESKDGQLKLAVVSDLPERTIFYGKEAAGSSNLAEALMNIGGRQYGENDIVFLHSNNDLQSSYKFCREDAKHLAIHNVATLLSSWAPFSSRDTLYLSCVIVLLESSCTSENNNRRLLEDFLSLWIRQVTHSRGDLEAWGEASLEKVRKVNPWAASFMEGLQTVMAQFEPIELPGSLARVLEAAQLLQAQATLENFQPSIMN